MVSELTGSEETAAPREPRRIVQRDVALLLVLGFATGFPAGWGWYNLSELLGLPGAERALARAAFPTWSLLTTLTLFGLVAFLAAPFLDRYSAPFFGRLGRRRSWAAAALGMALILTACLLAIHVLAPTHIADHALVACGAATIPVAAILWISLDALRIELRPGRAQAIAFGAQFLGSLVAAALLPRVADTGGLALVPIAAVALLLAIGSFAVLRIATPDAPVAPPEAPSRSPFAESVWMIASVQWLWRVLTQPWAAFFKRHGLAAPFVLVALAAYALGGSAAQTAANIGYTFDYLKIPPEELDRIDPVLQTLRSFDLLLNLIGGLVGVAVAARFSPASAFRLLQVAIIALAGLFLVCRLRFGFTAETLLALAVFNIVLIAAAIVVYAVVAARLTAPPHTAGQFYLLALINGVPWLSERAGFRVGVRTDGCGIVAAAVACPLIAIACMFISHHLVRRRHGRSSRMAAQGAAVG